MQKLEKTSPTVEGLDPLLNYTITNELAISLQMSFIQYNRYFAYYSVSDIFTAIGGISATISVAIDWVGILFMVQFSA